MGIICVPPNLHCYFRPFQIVEELIKLVFTVVISSKQQTPENSSV